MKNKLLSDSGMYLLATLIQSGIQLLFIPYLTRVLTLKEFALSELFLTSYGLFNIIILFGINTQIYRDVATSKSFMSSDNLRNYRNSVYGFLLNNSLLLFVIVLGIYVYLGQAYLYLLLGLICSIIYVYSIFELCLFQIKRKPQFFLYYNIAFSLLNVVITVAALSAFEMGYESRFLGFFVPAFTFFIILTSVFKPRFFTNDFEEYKNKVILCFPFFFASIASWIVESVDKFMLAGMISLEELAVYSVGYKFGMVMLLLTSAYSRAWMPYVVENIKSSKAIIKALIFSIVLLLSVFSGYLVAIYFVYPIIVPESYHSGMLVTIVIGGAYLIDGIAKLFNSIFVSLGRQGIYVMVTVVSGVGNMFMNYFLIPEYGYMGAAYATLISFLTALLLSLIYFSQIKRKGLV